jgi:hypothetical protein
MSKITFSISNNSDINVSIKITSINDAHLVVGDALKPNEEYLPNKKYVVCLENIPK